MELQCHRDGDNGDRMVVAVPHSGARGHSCRAVTAAGGCFTLSHQSQVRGTMQKNQFQH